MRTIFLSPHFDDAVLSCGGLIWDLAQSKHDVEVWTVCAGLPGNPELSTYAKVMHTVWELSVEEAVQSRRLEDEAALEVVGAPGRYFNIPDAIYRRHPKTGEFLYQSDEELYGGLQPGDRDNLRQISIAMAKALPDGEILLVLPLTVGNHVDHQLVRAAAERLPVRLAYYSDYPYTRKYPESARTLAPPGFQQQVYPVSAPGLAAWQDGIAAYASQISTFWYSESQMREEIAAYCQAYGGIPLWGMPEPGIEG